MGHKVNPIGFRLGVIKNWQSRWFNRKNYRRFLEQDHQVRRFIEKKLARSLLESIDITRSGNVISIVLKTARPGLVIGRAGRGLEDLQRGLNRLLRSLALKQKSDFIPTVKLEIEEVRKPEGYARLVAKNVADSLERRLPFRRVMKQTIDKVMQQKGVEGVKVMLAGRLGGAEIARTEHLAKGKIPLQTLRADIDYAQETAYTTYGTIGVKVWIYKGEIFESEKKKEE